MDISGGAGPDSVFVQAGASASLVELGNDDRIYLTGNLTDYSQAIDQDTGVYTFTRRTGLPNGQSEEIKVTVSNQNLVLSFADGKVILNAESNPRLYTGDSYQLVEQDSLVPGGTPAGGVAELQPVGVSAPSQFPIKVFISDSAGVDLPGLARAGQSMVVSGSGGVDRVYVMAGTSIDTSALGLGDDKVYLAGKLSDYTQSIDQDTGIYTFTRSAGLPVGQVEVVKVTLSNESDVLVFADGRITLNAEADTRLYSEGAGFQAIQSDWLDGSETTPGASLSVQMLQLSADTGVSATDFITSQAIQTVSGTLSAVLKPGMQLLGSVDGGGHWADITDKVTGTSIVWVGATLVGSNTIKFKTVDTAGHETVLAGVHDYQLDSAAPTAPSLALYKDTGIKAFDGITTEKEVEVSGLEAIAGWEYRIDGGSWEQGSGTGFAASSGRHSYEVRQVDTAGNYSAASGSKVISLESAVVTQTSAVQSITDDFTSNNSVGSISAPVTVVDGGSTDDARPSLSGSLDAALTAGQFLSVYDSVNGVKTELGIATVNADLSWVFTPAALSSGHHSFTVQVESIAGAKGTPSAAYQVAIHNSLPMSVSDDVGASQGVLASNMTAVLGALAINAEAKTLLVQGQSANVDVAALRFTLSWGGGGGGGGTLIPGLVDRSIAGKVTFWVGNFDGTTTRAIQMQLMDLPDGGVTLQALQGKSHQADAMSGSFNFDTDGQVDSTYAMFRTTYHIPAETDDLRPTFSGKLNTAVGAGEEVAVYQTHLGVKTKLGVATVRDLEWSFTPSTDLADGVHSFQAMLQPTGDASGDLGFVVSAPKTVVISSTAPFQLAVITSAADNADSYGSPATSTAVASGSSTNDATPTLSGTLDSALAGGQFLSVYDTVRGVKSKIGTATVNADLSWTFTPIGKLSNGQHSFSAQVESMSGAKAASSASYDIAVYNSLSMNVFDDVGAVQGVLTTVGASRLGPFAVGSAPQKLSIYTATSDLDISTFEWTMKVNGNNSAGTVIPGSIDHSVAGQVTFWVGTLAGEATAAVQMRFIDLPGGGVSLQELQGKYTTFNALTGSTDFNSVVSRDDGYTVVNVAYPVFYLPLTDDTRPAFGGVLNANVGTNEELAIYEIHNGVKAKLGVATVHGLDWSFTPAAELASGVYSFQAMLQPVGESTGTLGHVVSAPHNFVINNDIPNQLAVISSVTDNFTYNGSSGSPTGPATVANGSSTDDTTPTLNGTLDAALAVGEFLSVYDTFNAVTTNIGTAAVSADLSWTFTPDASLDSGLHRFTVRAESPAGKGAYSAAYDVALYKNFPINVFDDVGASQSLLATLKSSFSGFSMGSAPKSLLGYRNSADVDLSAFQWGLNFYGRTAQGTLITALTDYSVAGQVTFWVGEFDGTYTRAVQIQLKDLPGGGVSLQQVQAKYLSGNALTGSTINTSGGVDNGYAVASGVYPIPAVTDDARPSLDGTLGAFLDPSEEVAIYHMHDGNVTKLGVAAVNGLRWSFTPTTDLADGTYSFRALLQPVGDTTGTLGHVVSVSHAVVINSAEPRPTQAATIGSVLDNVSTNGSVGASSAPAVVALGGSTDDLTPTLNGTVDAALTTGQRLAVYDSVNGVKKKIGTATVNADLSWTFTPSSNLGSGQHSFTVIVESNAGVQGMMSPAYNIALYDSLAMSLTDDVGTVQGVVTSTPFTLGTFGVGDAPRGLLTHYDSNLIDLSSFKWVLNFFGRTAPGTLITEATDYSVAGQVTFWVGEFDGTYTRAVQIQLKDLPGGGVSLQQVQAKYLSGNALTGSTINTAGGVDNGFKVSGGTYTERPVLDDAKPTFAGVLSTTLDAAEEVAIYQTSNGLRTKLGVATVNDLNWSFTPASDLANGTYTFQAMLQPVGETNGTSGHVISAPLLVDMVVGVPMQTAVITSALDNASVNGSIGSTTAPVTVARGGSTDDLTPTLGGTLDAALTGGQFLSVYDSVNGVKTKIGSAHVNADLSWTFTPSSKLGSGQHSFTVIVESNAGVQGMMSPAYNIALYDSLAMSLTDDVGTVQGVVTSTPFTLGTFGVGDAPRGLLTHYDSNLIDLSAFKWVLNFFGRTAPGTLITDATDYSVAGQVTFWVGEFDGTYTRAVQIQLKDLPGGGVGLQQVQAKYLSGNALTGSTINTAGGVDNGFKVSGGIYTERPVLDDGKPTFAGVLSTTLDAAEEVAIYQTSNGLRTKLGVATVNDLNWSFTPASDLANGTYTFQAMLQPVGETNGTSGHVISAPLLVDIDVGVPMQTAVITSALDNASVNGSIGSTTAPVTVASGVSTDDLTPTLRGTLDAALTRGQLLSVYDSVNGVKTKIGSAHVNADLSWAFTPATSLGGGAHSFTVQVESGAGAKGASSAPYNVALYRDLSMSVSDDVGPVHRTLYDLGTIPVSSTPKPFFGVAHAADIVLSSFDWAVKFGDVKGTGRVIPGTEDRSVTGQVTFWVGNYSGAYTRAVQIQIKDFADGGVGVQALQAKFEKLYALDGSRDYSVVGYTDNTLSVTDVSYKGLQLASDSRPTFSGKLVAVLGTDEVVAIYQTLNGVKTKVGVAAVDGLEWSFKPDRDVADGTYGFHAVLESAGGEARVLSVEQLIDIDTLSPNAVAFIASALDKTSLNGSEGTASSPVRVEQGFSSDEESPTLTGTVDSTLKTFESLVIYDAVNGALTKLGTATVDGFNWSFIPGASLGPGTHNFVARVERSNGHTGEFSSVYDLIVHRELAMTVTENRGTSQLSLANGGGTSDKRPTFAGVLSVPISAGEEIAVYQSLDGVTSMVGVADVVGNSWSFKPLTDLVDGALSFKAVLQSAGNTTDARGHVISYSHLLIVDTAVPTQHANITSAEGSAGSASAVRNTIAQGNASDDLAPKLSGILSAQLSAGQTLVVYDTISGVRTKIGLASVTGTSWSFTPSSEMALGEHSFSVQVESAAGKKGSASPTFEVALYKGLSMIVSDDTGSDQGALGNGAGTDDRRPTFAGTLLTPLGADEEVAIYQTLLGVRTKIGVAAVSSNLGWSFTPSNDLASGTYTFDASLQSSSEQNRIGISGHVASAPLIVTIKADEGSPVLTVPTFTLTETGSESDRITLTAANLGLPPDLRSSLSGSLQVTEVEGGSFMNNGAAVTAFEIRDVENGLVQFVHPFNSGQPTFLLTVADRGTVLGIVKSNIDFRPIGHLIFGDGSGGGGNGSHDGGNGGDGGEGDDTLLGSALGDVIFGDGSGGGEGQHGLSAGGAAHAGAAGGGKDTIYGRAGDDIIFGDGFAGQEIAQYTDAFKGGQGGYGGGGSGSGNKFRSIGGGGEGESSWVGVHSSAGYYGYSNRTVLVGSGGGVSADGSSSDGASGNETSVEVALWDFVYHRVLDDWNNQNSQIYKQMMGSGDDVIDGGEGNDRIMAGGGNDIVIGGLGADILWGGAGADKFIFRLADFDGSTDVIQDFKYKEGDQILIQSGADTKLDFSYNEPLRQATIKVDPLGGGILPSRSKLSLFPMSTSR